MISVHSTLLCEKGRIREVQKHTDPTDPARCGSGTLATGQSYIPTAVANPITALIYCKNRDFISPFPYAEVGIIPATAAATTRRIIIIAIVIA
jgi:hypothetical protein